MGRTNGTHALTNVIAANHRAYGADSKVEATSSGVAPDIQNSEVHVRQYRFNSADFLKLGVSNAFVIDETNRNLR